MKMYGEEKRKRKKRRKTHRGLVVLFLLLLVIACVAGAMWLSYVKPPEVDTPKQEPEVVEKKEEDEKIKVRDSRRKDNFYNVLIVGTDLNGVHTDSIMLASFNVETKKLNVLSIPRDTIVNVKRSNKKINAAFPLGGIEQLYDEIETVIGFKPDKHVIVSTQGFIEMIDAIDGVEVDVQRDMKYSDPTQDLYIDIDKGLQTLDGYDSMCFMRYRYGYAEGDVGRVRAQQQFVNALMKKMISPATLSKLPELCEIVMDNVETDLTIGNLIWLGKEALSMNLETDLATYIVPGEGQYYQKLSYFIPYENQLLSMINEVFNPYIEPIDDVDIFDFVGKTGTALLGE